MNCVLINGGSRGIGAAMVKLFSKNGWQVAFTYKSSCDEANRLAQECGALAIQADSADEEAVNRAVDVTLSEYGHIDCLINNAAISSFSLFTDITLAQWNAMLSVNLTGAFLFSRAVAHCMISRKYGRIINISSMWGITGASCEVHYSTAKAGLIGMTKALAKELGPSGITVNAIAPGVIDTDMNRKHLSEEDMVVLENDTPLMRIGSTDDVAATAYFLAGEGASFITGDVLNVNGGYLI